ncbi:MAG: hypothetical protein Q4A90_03900 [Streptococcus sp.]|nr:hypothetical protein [Streptococcus sp.]
MRLNSIKKLLDINILYAVPPTQLQKYRREQSKKPEKKINISAKLIRTHLLLGLFYFFMFGINGALNLFNNPSIFSNMVLIFALFSMSQGFLSFYNVFYESKDLQAYRPYAFTELEIIIGKSFSVLLTLLIAILPMYTYFFGLALLGSNIFLSLLASLLSIVIFSANLVLFILVLVHFITKTTFFRRYKNIIANIVLAVVFIASMVFYIFINQINNISVTNRTFAKAFFPPIESFAHFILHPTNPSFWIGILMWIGAVLLLLIVVKKKVLPEFYESALKTGTTINKKISNRQTGLNTNRSFSKFVWYYHIRLLGENSVVMQIVTTAVFPYIMLFSIAFSILSRAGSISNYLTPQFLLPLIALSSFISLLNSGGNNLTSIGISLERENFDYIKILPLNFKKYIFLKFWYLFAIQSILPVTLLLIISLIFGVHPIPLVAMVFTWFSISLFFSIWGYHRDYKKLVKNWSNVTELMNRDSSIVKALIGLLLFFFFGGVIALLFVISAYLPILIIYFTSLVLLVLMGLCSCLAYRYFMNKVIEEIMQLK